MDNYYSGDQINKKGIGGTFNTEDRKWVYTRFLFRTERERENADDVGIDRRSILE